jgi:hypothetical protein
MFDQFKSTPIDIGSVQVISCTSSKTKNTHLSHLQLGFKRQLGQKGCDITPTQTPIIDIGQAYLRALPIPATNFLILQEL